MEIQELIEKYNEKVSKVMFYPEPSDYYKDNFIFDSTQTEEWNKEFVLKENKKLDKMRERVVIYKDETEQWFEDNYIKCLLDKYDMNLKQAIAIFDYLKENYSIEFKENAFYFQFAGELATKIIHAEKDITFLKKIEK